MAAVVSTASVASRCRPDPVAAVVSTAHPRLLSGISILGRTIFAAIRVAFGLLLLAPVTGLTQDRARPAKPAGETEFEEVLPAAVDATAQMDSEANAIFMQANAFAAEGKYELVFRLLEQALALSGQTMASADGEHYQPARLLAIRILREMPKEVLASYRLLVDPLARRQLQLFGRDPQRERLERVYWQQFLSSHGDNAAYVLACLELDQHNFARARRILTEIRRLHPDSDVPASELLPRLALACVRSLDVYGAEQAWQAYRMEAPELPPKWLPVEAEIEALVRDRERPTGELVAAYGDFQRLGRLPAFAAGRDALWTMHWELPIEYESAPQNVRHIGIRPTARKLSPVTMARRMHDYGWRPADQIVSADGKLWYTDQGQVICLDLQTGKRRWVSPKYADKQDGKRYPHYYRRLRHRGAVDPSTPNTPQEIFAFGDRLARDLSLVGDAVYRIDANESSSFMANLYGVRIVNGRRVRREIPVGNVLTALDRKTGKVKWRIGREPGAKETVISIVGGKLFDIPEVDKITIDGDPKDWAGRGYNVPMPPKPGADKADFSTQVHLGWNRKGLLVRVETKDSIIQEHKDTKQMFRGDSVELFVAERRSNWNMYQIIVSTGADKKHPKPRFYIYDHRRRKRRTSPKTLTATFGHSKIKGGYIVEGLLPWKNLGITPRVKSEIGFQIYVNDVDGKGKHFICKWYPRNGTHMNPGLMQRLRLTDPRGRTRAEPGKAVAKKKVPPKRWKANRLRFLATPVGWADRLLVPFEDELGFYVAALEPSSGLPLWQTRIASSVPASEPPESTCHITMQGALAYLCTGQGQVACIDAADGAVLWVTTYESTRVAVPLPEFEAEAAAGEEDGDAGAAAAADGDAAPELPRGWEENLVVCYGSRALVLPSDSPSLICVDRISGRRQWVAPKPEGVDYFVGLRAGKAVVAGTNRLIAYDLETGRPAWREKLDHSSGRAVLADDEILTPVGKRIQRFAVADGKRRGTVHLQTPQNLPVGNLYVSDAGLVVAGPNRVYLLRNAKGDLERLNRRIATGKDVKARRERAELYYSLRRYPEALADFRAVHEAATGPAGETARRDLLRVTLEFAGTGRRNALELLRAAGKLARTPAEKLETAWALGCLLETLGKPTEAFDTFLAALPAAAAGTVPVTGADRSWVMASRPAIWRRLLGLRDQVEAQRRAGIDRIQQEILNRAKAAEDDEQLAGITVDFEGTAAARDAAVLLAARFRGRQQYGAAAAVLARVRTGSAPARRPLHLAWLELYLAADRSREGRLLLAQLAVADPQWQAPALQAVAAKLETGKAPPAGCPVPPLKRLWKHKLPRGYISANFFSGAGWIYVSPHSGSIGCLRLADGKKLWERKFDRRQAQMYQTLRPTNLLPTATGAEVKTMETWNGKDLATRPSPIADGVLQAVDAGGLAMFYTAANGGTLAVMDLLSGRLLWRREDISSRMAEVRSSRVFAGPGRFVLMGYKATGSIDVLTFEAGTGRLSRREGDRNEWNAVHLQAQMGGAGGYQPPGGLELNNGVLRRLEPGTKKVIWKTPKLGISRFQPAARGYLAVELGNGEAGAIRLRDGKLTCRSRKPVSWRYVRAENSIPSVMFVQYGTQQQVFAVNPATGKVLFDGKVPQYSQALLPAGAGLLLIRYRKVTKQGNRRRYSAYQIRYLKADGKLLPEVLPRSADIAKNEQRHYWLPNFGKGVLLLVNRSTGSVVAYVRAEAGDRQTGGAGKRPEK